MRAAVVKCSALFVPATLCDALGPVQRSLETPRQRWDPRWHAADAQLARAVQCCARSTQACSPSANNRPAHIASTTMTMAVRNTGVVPALLQVEQVQFARKRLTMLQQKVLPY